MSREILYRGFHECENGTTIITLDSKQYKGEWKYGNYVKAEEMIGNCKYEHYIIEVPAIGTSYRVIIQTVGEYTGLTDKNGRKIFEGDVVKLREEWRREIYEWQATVEFGNPNGYCDWGWQLKPITKNIKVNTDILCWVEAQSTGAFCEIIGNIFERVKEQ